MAVKHLSRPQSPTAGRKFDVGSSLRSRLGLILRSVHCTTVSKRRGIEGKEANHAQSSPVHPLPSTHTHFLGHCLISLIPFQIQIPPSLDPRIVLFCPVALIGEPGASVL